MNVGYQDIHHFLFALKGPLQPGISVDYLFDLAQILTELQIGFKFTIT